MQSHVTHLYSESRHTYEGAMSYIRRGYSVPVKESCTYEQVMSYIHRGYSDMPQHIPRLNEQSSSVHMKETYETFVVEIHYI